MHDTFNILRRYVFIFQIPWVKSLYGLCGVNHLHIKCGSFLDRWRGNPGKEEREN
jgi:hypothetical protein